MKIIDGTLSTEQAGLLTATLLYYMNPHGVLVVEILYEIDSTDLAAQFTAEAAALLRWVYTFPGAIWRSTLPNIRSHVYYRR